MHLHLPETGPVMLQTHVAMLGQAVDNYIDNALKYSRQGSQIDIFLEERLGIVSIIVQDEGQGINPEEKSEIFSPFFRSNEARSRGVEGFGLGLAIVARLTHALGGECSVSSKPGEGSRFMLTFNKTTMMQITYRSKLRNQNPKTGEVDHFLSKTTSKHANHFCIWI
jgi:signal transduction histidine kinase